MKKLLLGLLILLTLGAPTKSQAYDEDIHFYNTYAVARYAGIKHEVALYLAIAAQWMDESKFTAPIQLDLIGARIRQTFHFPVPLYELTDPTRPDDWGQAVNKYLQIDLSQQVIPNSVVANQLISKGLEESNLLVVGNGLHVLEDSFAHAGFPFSAGHAAEGHWPDRPFGKAQDSLPKFKDMVHVLFKVMVAIRRLIPHNAVDTSSPHFMQDSETLANAYLNEPGINEILNHYIMTDPEYVTVAITETLKRAQDIGYIYKDANVYELLAMGQDSIDYQHTAYDVLNEIGLKILQKQIQQNKPILNCAFIDLAIGNGTSTVPCNASATKEEIVNRVSQTVTLFAQNYIPFEFTPTHKTETENDDSPIRIVEMEMRNRDWERLIPKMFGVAIIKPDYVGDWMSDTDKFNFYQTYAIMDAASPYWVDLESELNKYLPISASGPGVFAMFDILVQKIKGITPQQFNDRFSYGFPGQGTLIYQNPDHIVAQGDLESQLTLGNRALLKQWSAKQDPKHLLTKDGRESIETLIARGSIGGLGTEKQVNDLVTHFSQINLTAPRKTTLHYGN